MILVNTTATTTTTTTNNNDNHDDNDKCTQVLSVICLYIEHIHHL